MSESNHSSALWGHTAKPASTTEAPKKTPAQKRADKRASLFFSKSAPNAHKR